MNYQFVNVVNSHFVILINNSTFEILTFDRMAAIDSLQHLNDSLLNVTKNHLTNNITLSNDSLKIFLSSPVKNDDSILITAAPYIISILVALIAGFVALRQVKVNAITTARLKWIDELRLLESTHQVKIWIYIEENRTYNARQKDIQNADEKKILKNEHNKIHEKK